MKFGKRAVSAAAAAALATGALAPTASADDVPRGGSAMWLYDTITINMMRDLDRIHGGPERHQNEKFWPVMMSAMPAIVLLSPLQFLAEAEVRLSSQFGI